MIQMNNGTLNVLERYLCSSETRPKYTFSTPATLLFYILMSRNRTEVHCILDMMKEMTAIRNSALTNPNATNKKS